MALCSESGNVEKQNQPFCGKRNFGFSLFKKGCLDIRIFFFFFKWKCYLLLSPLSQIAPHFQFPSAQALNPTVPIFGGFGRLRIKSERITL